MRLTYGLFALIALAILSGAVVGGVVANDWCVSVYLRGNENWTSTGPSLVCILVPLAPVGGALLFLGGLLMRTEEAEE